MDNTTVTFKNVLLETGFEYIENQVVHTKTALFCIELLQGKIKSISPNDPNAQAIDAKGRLMLPAFKDMHAHLDKMLFGLPWQAISPNRTTVKDMIAYEQQMIPTWLETSTERTQKMIDYLQSFGTDFVRSHFNVDPTSGLDSLKNLEKALMAKSSTLDTELVAFAQHGVFYTETLSLLRDVAQLKQVDFIGGVDPYTLDGSIEKSLGAMVTLALENEKGIDLHLHEMGESGLQTIEYLIQRVKQYPVLAHKVFISHAYVLSQLGQQQLDAVAHDLAEHGIGIVSSIPFGKFVMPIPTLKKHGVQVLVGNDNIQDHWNTLGSGNMLEKAHLIAQLYDYQTEYLLSRALGFATKDILPLDDKGNQQWPKVGDTANMVFVQASCSAEAVSRVSKVISLVHKGKIVF